jgi:EmrB/QacA subfamily drug resistance transporter
MTNDRSGDPRTPSASRSGAAGGSVPAPDPKRWIALTIVLIAGFMDLLDVTIVNVAVPSILKDLHAAYAQIEWVIAGYMLGIAAFLITGGRLGDIYGRKRMFLIGVAGFTIASALCGVSVSPAMLIASRFFEGAMSGLMVPQILAIIQVAFPREERGTVFGIWGSVLGAASALGVVISGLFLRWNIAGWQWRPIFLINIPIGIGAFIAAWFFVRESRSPAAPRVDLAGMVLTIAGVLMLVYPLAEGRTLGWPAWTFALMAGSLVVFAILVVQQRWRTRSVGSPLIVLSLFRGRSFSAGMVVWLLFWVVSGGFFLVWTLYMQVGIGWSPLRAGLTAVSYAVGAGAGSALSVKVFTPRFGRGVLMAGSLVNIIGFVGYGWIAFHYGPGIHPWQMLAPLAVTGFGFGLVVAPTVDAILTGVPTTDAGSASGVLNTTQQVGGALGIALIGVLFFTLLAGDSGRGVSAVTPDLRGQLTAAGVPAASQGEVIAGFRACVHDRSAETDPTVVPASCQPRPLPGASPGEQARIQAVLTRAAVQANAYNFARNFDVTMWYASGMLVVIFFGMFGLPRQVRIRGLEDELATVPGQEYVRGP